jgi:preprotein translocase subunit YajC
LASSSSAGDLVLLLGHQRAQAFELGLVARGLGAPTCLEAALRSACAASAAAMQARRASSSARISGDWAFSSPRRARAASKASGLSRMARMSCMPSMEAFGQFVPLILIFAIMYFLLIRPQQKKLKEHRQMVESLRRGDQVVTQGGLIGKVTKVKDDTNEIEVEIATGVQVRVIRATIAEVLNKTEPAK